MPIKFLKRRLLKRKRKVLAFGAFDVLHPGHIEYLKWAGSLGDELVVVLAKDSTLEKTKGMPFFNERERKKMLEALRFVDRVVLGLHVKSLEGREKYKVVVKEKPDVIALGYDQKIDFNKLKAAFASVGVKAVVKRMPAFKLLEHKSSVVKRKLFSTL